MKKNNEINEIGSKENTIKSIFIEDRFQPNLNQI